MSLVRTSEFPLRPSNEPRFLSIPEVPTPAETIWWKYVDLFVENSEKSLPRAKKINEKIYRKKSRNKKIHVHADSPSVGEYKNTKIFKRATRRVRVVESAAEVLLPRESLGSEPVLPRE